MANDDVLAKSDPDTDDTIDEVDVDNINDESQSEELNKRYGRS